MSIHKSLFIGGALDAPRSVLSRRERLETLAKEGRWEEEGNSVFGLPKVRTKFKVLNRKKKKEGGEDEGAVVEGAEAAAEGEKAETKES